MFRQAQVEDIKPGQYIAIDYRSGGLDRNILLREPLLYMLNQIERVDNIRIWLKSGSGMTLKGCFVPSPQVLSDFLMYLKFYNEKLKVTPIRGRRADDQIEQDVICQQYAFKRFKDEKANGK